MELIKQLSSKTKNHISRLYEQMKCPLCGVSDDKIPIDSFVCGHHMCQKCRHSYVSNKCPKCFTLINKMDIKDDPYLIELRKMTLKLKETIEMEQKCSKNSKPKEKLIQKPIETPKLVLNSSASKPLKSHKTKSIREKSSRKLSGNVSMVMVMSDDESNSKDNDNSIRDERSVKEQSFNGISVKEDSVREHTVNEDTVHNNTFEFAKNDGDSVTVIDNATTELITFSSIESNALNDHNDNVNGIIDRLLSQTESRVNEPDSPEKMNNELITDHEPSHLIENNINDNGKIQIQAKETLINKYDKSDVQTQTDCILPIIVDKHVQNVKVTRDFGIQTLITDDDSDGHSRHCCLAKIASLNLCPSLGVHFKCGPVNDDLTATFTPHETGKPIVEVNTVKPPDSIATVTSLEPVSLSSHTSTVGPMTQLENYIKDLDDVQNSGKNTGKGSIEFLSETFRPPPAPKSIKRQRIKKEMELLEPMVILKKCKDIDKMAKDLAKNETVKDKDNGKGKDKDNDLKKNNQKLKNDEKNDSDKDNYAKGLRLRRGNQMVKDNEKKDNESFASIQNKFYESKNNKPNDTKESNFKGSNVKAPKETKPKIITKGKKSLDSVFNLDDDDTSDDEMSLKRHSTGSLPKSKRMRHKRSLSPALSVTSVDSVASRQSLRTRESYESSQKKLIKYCLMMSNLDEKQKIYVNKRAHELHATVVSEWTDHVTHLICAVNDDPKKLIVSRTLKYLKALMGNRWIVSYNWFVDSCKSNRFLNESSYEIRGVKQFPDVNAPQMSRKSGKKLFDNFKVYFKGDFANQSPSIGDMKEFVRIAGGNVIENEKQLEKAKSDKQLLKNGKIIIVNKNIGYPDTQNGVKWIGVNAFIEKITKFQSI